MHEFQTHENNEGQSSLSTSKKIGHEFDDPLVRFLLNLIMADEERHSEVLGRMVSSLNISPK